MEIAELYQKISYKFKDESLLIEAITHPSMSKKFNNIKNYQRLEFLGDKVLGLVITNFLLEKFPEEKEGDLSKRHASLVSGETLSEIALKIGIDKIIRISDGEEKLGGKTNKRNLENTLEALIGAIYMDSNYEYAKKFVLKFWSDFLEKNNPPPKDPVSQLQEIVQLKYKQLPLYKTSKEGGLDHLPIFTSKLKIPNENLEFVAKGNSKKEAQKQVAKIALEFLLNNNQ